MNELIFFGQIGLVVAFVLGAQRLGKGALTAIVALQAVVANLFVIKQIDLFGMSVTASDVYIIGSILAMNLIQEFYGRPAAMKAIWISFFSLVFFGVMGQVQLLYQPNSYDWAHDSYATLLAVQPRILLASLAAYLVTQQLDLRLFARLKKTKWPLPVRSGLSLIICQLSDTILFAILGLAGMVHSLLDIIVVSFAIKVAIILCMTPLTALTLRRPDYAND